MFSPQMRRRSGKDSMPLLLSCVLLLVLALADLDYDRVHLIDHAGTNFFFRGNMPVNTTTQTFSYDSLVGYMRQRAQEAGVSMPSSFRLAIISLNTPLDKGYSAEAKFWKDPANADKGNLTTWTLGVSGILPPSSYSESQRESMAIPGTDKSVW